MSYALTLSSPHGDLHVTADNHAKLRAAGLSTDWISMLVQTVGPTIANLLINLIINKPQPAPNANNLKGVFDNVNLTYLRNLLADALRQYKQTVGTDVEQWVEQGIEALASYIGAN